MILMMWARIWSECSRERWIAEQLQDGEGTTISSW
jgi:hypothetical protein